MAQEFNVNEILKEGSAQYNGVINQMTLFLNKFYKDKLLTAIREGEKSLSIEFKDLDLFNSDISEMLLNHPRETLNMFYIAVEDESVKARLDNDSIKIIPRFYNIPESCNTRLRDIRSEHMNKLISIVGVIRTSSEVKHEIVDTVWTCDFCGSLVKVEQNKPSVLIKPQHGDCENEGCQADRETFTILRKYLDDIRFLKIEDTYESSSGEALGSGMVFARGDLNDLRTHQRTEAGAIVEIVGIMREVDDLPKKNAKQVVTFIDAVSIKNITMDFDDMAITPEDKAKIIAFSKSEGAYDKLVDSIAPSIYGLRSVKEALLLQMFSGVKSVLKDGSRLRGDIHVLLVGDPSTAKTILLKIMAGKTPRSRYVSGQGATAAGLTAAAVKDEISGQGWMLQAGALVLSHKGGVSIDEFDKMTKENASTLHEAMSTQTVTVAKASIYATLPSETHILAGANPKRSRFDIYQSLASQIDISDTLLSRFDLKFILRDVADEKRDGELIDYIREARIENMHEPALDTEFLKKYVSYAKRNCKPEMTKQAWNKLKGIYVDLRKKVSGNSGAMPITTRQFEALVRLSQASAKCRLSDTVEVQDTDKAIFLLKETISQLGIDPDTGELDIDRIDSGVGQTDKSQSAILDIIFGDDFGKQVKFEDAIRLLRAHHMKKPEHSLEELIQNGSIIEFRPGILGRVH